MRYLSLESEQICKWDGYSNSEINPKQFVETVPVITFILFIYFLQQIKQNRHTSTTVTQAQLTPVLHIYTTALTTASNTSHQ